jgi:hypothetical protein
MDQMAISTVGLESRTSLLNLTAVKKITAGCIEQFVELLISA